jgi:hypothetical protein
MPELTVEELIMKLKYLLDEIDTIIEFLNFKTSEKALPIVGSEEKVREGERINPYILKSLYHLR